MRSDQIHKVKEIRKCGLGGSETQERVIEITDKVKYESEANSESITFEYVDSKTPTTDWRIV